MQMKVLSLFFTILLILLLSCKEDGISVDAAASEEEKLFFEDYTSPQFKWGFLDIKGKIVIEDEYDHARDFSEGLAAVNKSGKWGYINSNGEIVVPFQYRSAGAFSCNRALVQDFEFNQFFINPSGKTVIEISDATISPDLNAQRFQISGRTIRQFHWKGR